MIHRLAIFSMILVDLQQPLFQLTETTRVLYVGNERREIQG